MPFVVNEQTGSKVFSDPKLREECLLHDQTHRQSIEWVKLPHMAFHVILTISSEI